MRFYLLPLLASAALASACGDDKTDTDTGTDTVVDTSTDTGTTNPDTSDTGTTETDSDEPLDTADTSDTSDDTNVPVDTEDAGDLGDTTVPVDTEDVADTDPPDVGPTIALAINEISATGTDPDWVEIYNGGTGPADIGGYLLRDDDPAHSYIIPAGTIIPAGAYLAIDQGDGTTGFDFGLGDADGAFLFDRDDIKVDDIVWVSGEAPLGATYGRFPNGSGNFKTLYVPTKGTPNVDNPATECGNNIIEPSELCDGTALPAGVGCGDRGFGGGTLGCDGCQTLTYDTCLPHAAALVINEVDSTVDKIELFNGTNAAIQLGGYQVKDASDNTYTFPTRTMLAGGYVVLSKGVEFDFGLGGDDLVRLLNSGGSLVDQADWLDGEALVSYCRSPNGTGGFESCEAASFGSANP